MTYHIPVEKWLDALALPQYTPLFTGYGGVENLLDLTDEEVRLRGVADAAHRSHIHASLVILKDKLRKQILKDKLSGGVPSKLPVSPDYEHLFTESSRQAPSEDADSQDLHKYLWFHGKIPRQQAEALVTEQGDFLVRESVSEPGSFVLTMLWNRAPLHFRIHTTPAASGVQYQFEGARFDRVAELLQHHIATNRPISATSGAVISAPVARMRTAMTGRPLSLHGASLPEVVTPLTSKRNRSESAPQEYIAPTCHGNHGSPAQRPLPELPKEPTVDHIPNENATTETASSADSKKGIKGFFSRVAQSLPSSSDVRSAVESTVQRTEEKLRAQPSPSLLRRALFKRSCEFLNKLTGSETDSVTSQRDDVSREAPPKPSRVPSVRYRLSMEQRPLVLKKMPSVDDGKDYSDYDQVKAWPGATPPGGKTGDKHAAPPADKSRSEVGDKAEPLAKQPFQKLPYLRPAVAQEEQEVEDPDYDNNFQPNESVCDRVMDYDVPVPSREVSPEDKAAINRKSACSHPVHQTDCIADVPSSINLLTFVSEILPPENVPLHGPSMGKVKVLLLGGSAKDMAMHLTMMDVKIMRLASDAQLGLGVRSGLELLTLPHGTNLRQDIIERTGCLCRFVMLTVLLCSRHSERSTMLHQWVTVAGFLKTLCGDLLAFTAIMEALAAPPVTRLTATWLMFRQNYAQSAFLHESKLRGLVRSLEEASYVTVPNVCIPHVMPVVQLLERRAENSEDLLPWEQQRTDYGLDIMLAHLDSLRLVTEQCQVYAANAQTVLTGFNACPALDEIFSTEFHMRLLWGSRGAGASRLERYSKFDQLLIILSERIEPPAAGQ